MPATTLPAGTPLWKPPFIPGAASANPNTELRVWHPEETDASCTVFAGVTCRQGEPITDKIPVVTKGQAYARVKGPVEVNDALGFSATHDYLVRNGGPSCGKAMGQIAAAEVRLIPVELGATPPEDAVICARVVSEGADALFCTLDGGESVFAVMKPEPLRLSWVLGDWFGSVQNILQFSPTVTQVVDQAVWDALGYVINFRTNIDYPAVSEEHQAVWPPWVDNIGPYSVSSPVNQPRTADHGSGRITNIVCARVVAIGRVNNSELREDPAGEIVVNYVDITPGRSWVATDVIHQQQEVRSGGALVGIVDNTPTNA